MKKLSLCGIAMCLLFVLGCQKENLNEQEDISIHADVHNNLFKKGKLNDYSELKKYVDDNIKTKGKNQLSRTAFETDNNFTILEDQDISVHTGDQFNTYTIPVIKAEQPIGTFTNLVVQFKIEVDSTSAYLLNYTPTNEYLQSSALDSRAAFSGGVSYEPLDYDGSLDGMNARLVCKSISVNYCNYDGAVHNAGNCTPANMWTEVYQICYESEGNGPVYNSIDEPDGPSGGGGGGATATHNPYSGSGTTPTNPFVFYQNSVRNALGLNDFTDAVTISWIENVENVVDVLEIHFYLKSNLDENGNYEQEALDYVDEIFDAIEDETMISVAPFVKYPTGSTYATDYPKLTEYLKNQLPLIKDNNTIVNKIVQYGDLDAAEVKDKLQWGKGPTINVVQLDAFCTSCDTDTYGLYQLSNLGVINIDLDLVNDLEDSTPGSGLADAFAFLAGVTILHEFVHFSEYTDSTLNSDTETGILFEIDVYGQSVWRHNVEMILNNNND